MKILLITKTESYPLGLASISAMLKEAGHEVKGINLEYEPINRIYLKEKIREFKPDIVGLSVMYSVTESIFKKVAKWVKEESKFIVVGGVIPTTSPENFINKDINAICIGEGEYPLLELANDFNNRHNIKNFWLVEQDKVIKNEIRELIQDLDALPFPDRELFNIEDKEMPVMSGRGCPFNCTYCINHVYKKVFKDKGKYVRKRSPENFIEEIKLLKAMYRPKYFFFYDDTFIINPAWINEFTELYKKENIGIPFSTCTNPLTLNKEVLEKLKDAGLYLLRIGLESGNEEIRNNILKRNVSNKELNDFFTLVKQYGIQIKTYNILGLPYETKSDVYETILMNIRINPEIPHYCYYQPFKNTELGNFCYENELVKNDILGFHTEPVIETGHLSLKQVKKLYQAANFVSTLNIKYPSLFKNKPDRFIKFFLDFLYYGALNFQVLPNVYKKVTKAKVRV